MHHLIQQPIGEELLIFDKETHQCHSFTEYGAFVQKRLLEEATHLEIVEAFKVRYPQLSANANELVTAVSDYSREHRMSGKESHPGVPSETRRMLLKVAGITLVSTILALEPAAAQSTTLTIVSASYEGSVASAAACGGSTGTFGSNNVTATVQSAVTGDSVSIGVNNGTFGPDPAGGTNKWLVVTVNCGAGNINPPNVCEGGTFNFTCP